MAEKIRPKRATVVRQTTHPGDTRPNIPTAELESFARPEEKRPAIVRYPRDPTLDPQLVRKGKDGLFNAKRAGEETMASLRHPLWRTACR